MIPAWELKNVKATAVGRSVSRRTDIPALYPDWFLQRMVEGIAEYEPAGPPRRIACSLRPEELTHLTFWSKWPQPFFPVLEKLLAARYPVLWNVTVTGLGATPVEPGVPPAKKAVRAIAALAGMVGPAAIQWRYDPIFLSRLYGHAHHEESFRRLAGELAGHVDRVAVSFLIPFSRRVAPNLRKYETATGDRVACPPLAEQLDLLGTLHERACEAGVRFTVCCSEELRGASGYEVSGCNSWEWLRRVYSAFANDRRRLGRGKNGCCCGREIDVGAYETCTLGCVYSYGTCDRGRARACHKENRPESRCILPPRPAASAARSPFKIL